MSARVSRSDLRWAMENILVVWMGNHFLEYFVRASKINITNNIFGDMACMIICMPQNLLNTAKINCSICSCMYQACSQICLALL